MNGKSFTSLDKSNSTSLYSVGHFSLQVFASAAADPPKYTLLTYEYVPDILEKRGPYREGHLAAAFQKVRSTVHPARPHHAYMHGRGQAWMADQVG